MLVLAACGQPLQISTTPRATRTPLINPAPTPRPAATAAETRAPLATALPPATQAPALPEPTPTPAVVIVPQTAPPQTGEQIWRTQQVQREVLTPVQIYVAQSPVPLLWFDPVTRQSIEIGTLVGEFPVQARFLLRETNQPALEVPYRINQDYGLTSISEALRNRMQAAGYTVSVEAFVLQTDAVQPR